MTLTSLRARGIPTRPVDFAAVSTTPPPDDQNAAIAFLAAGSVLRIPPNLYMFYRHFPAERELARAEEVPLNALVAANERAILLARSAINRSGVDWGESNDPTTAVRGHFEVVGTPMLAELSGILNDAAALAHHQHDDAAAVEDVLACLRLSDAVSAGPPVLNTDQTASSIADGAARTLGPISPGLELDKTALGLARMLLKHLCDESTSRRCGINAMYGQACWALSRITADRYATGPARLVRPMYILEADRLLKLDDAAAAVMGGPSLASMPVLLEEDGRSPSLLYNISHMFSLGTKPFVRSSLELHFDALQQRRFASIALAARLFEIDHGKRPIDMEALVPAYLSATPIDALTGLSITLTPHARPKKD